MKWPVNSANFLLNVIVVTMFQRCRLTKPKLTLLMTNLITHLIRNRFRTVTGLLIVKFPVRKPNSFWLFTIGRHNFPLRPLRL